MEKEFFSMRPRIVDMRDEQRDTGRWLVEGKLVPRLPFTKGVGGGGFRYQTPRHGQMRAKDNSLDDIEGCLQDLDQMEIDFQIVYPTALIWVFDLENKELAGAVCRAYNNYIAEQCSKARKRVSGVALVPIQDPAAAVEEARRAIQQIGASWLPYWNWLVGKHIEHVLEPRAGRQESNWGREPYELPSTVHEPIEDILEGRILSGFEGDENLRSIIDQLGSKGFMYASDYPHSDMDWGRVQAIKGVEALTQAEKAALLGENARRFYNLAI